MQPYLKCQLINKEEGRLLFALRSRGLPLKNNRRAMFGDDVSCQVCQEEDSCEEESHLPLCSSLKSEIHEDEKDIRYEDVFGPLNKQIRCVKLYSKLVRRRNTILEIS